MALHQDHELHRRRFGRNVAVLALLCGFIVLVFALTVVKIQRGDFNEAFDHVARPQMIPTDEATQ